jgi:hypothetical protein
VRRMAGIIMAKSNDNDTHEIDKHNFANLWLMSVCCCLFLVRYSSLV